jgi:glycosyltransferase involved in cell wall biosynthesis
MKVGIITGNTGSVRSGIHNYIYHLIQQLKKNRDLELTLTTRDKQPIFPDLPSITPIYPFPGFSIFFWCQFLSLQKNVFSRFDLVHNPGQFPIFIKPSERYICTIHDLTPVLFPQYHPLWRTMYSRIAIPRLVKCSDKIITVSLQTKKDLISNYQIHEDKISVIYEGASKEYRKLDTHAVDTIRRKYELDDPFVLFLGNLEPRKNIPNLIRAFSRCRNQNANLKLVIAGKKGWMFEEIFTTITELHLEDSVKFLDYVPQDDLPALYNAARVFVYVPFYEGFGLPVLEAMQCGTPVITSNTSSLPEIIGDSGIMVDPLDIADLAEKMTQLISDDHLREENIRYNRSRCQHFSWEKCAQKTVEIYEEVCNKT